MKRIFVFTVCAFFITLLFCVAVSRIVYPYDVANEALNWTPSQLIFNGHNPYGFAMKPPFVMAPYGVVFYLVIGVGVKLFGFQFWFGRTVSLLSILICAYCAARIVFALTKEKHACYIATAAFLASLPFQFWIATQRSDMLSLAFSAVALMLVFEIDEKQKATYKKLLVIIALFALSFFVKHTTLLPIFIAALRLVQIKRTKQALVLLLSLFVICSVVMFLLNQTSDGGYIWQHFIHANQLPFDYEATYTTLMIILKTPSTFVYVAIISLCVYYFFATRSSKTQSVLSSPKWLIAFYFLVAFIFAFVTASRFGAATNYYLETSFVVSILTALCWEKLSREGRLRLSYSSLIALLFIAGSFYLVRVVRSEYYRWQELPYYNEMVMRLNQTIPPKSVCMSVRLELVTAGGHQYHFDDWAEYAENWSPELNRIFRQRIEEKHYAAIIWYTDEVNEQFKGYRLIRMSHPVPQKHYPVFLFVREDLIENSERSSYSLMRRRFQ